MYRLSRPILVLFLLLVAALPAAAPAAAQIPWPPSGCQQGVLGTGAV